MWKCGDCPRLPFIDAMNPSRLLPPTFALLLFAGLVNADSIKLKNGDILKGEILAETADSITLEFEVSKGIRDEKQIPRDDIQSITKDDPADKAWLVLTRSIPTADLLGPADYDTLIDRTNNFLRSHGTSMKAGQARRLLESLREERARVARGDMKLNGEWISVEQYQREKFWVDGRISLKSMAKAGQAGRYQEALRQYDAIEETYKGTTIHAKAITEVTSILKRYAAAVAEAIANQPGLAEQRAKRLATLTPGDRVMTEQAQADEAAALKAKIDAEMKTGSKWITLDAYSQESLTAASQTISKELARLATIDTSDATGCEALLRQIDQAVQEGRLDSAVNLVQKAPGSLKGSPYLKTLEERVKSEVSRINAENKARQDALKEAEMRAARAIPKPVVPKPISDEDKNMDQAVSPIVRAVRESDMGKRAAGDPPPPAPAPEPAPAPVVEEPKATVTPRVDASAADRAVVKAKPAKSKDGILTPVLYGLAAILVIALIAVLVMPYFKKKEPEEVAEPEAPTQAEEPESPPKAEAGESTPDE